MFFPNTPARAASSRRRAGLCVAAAAVAACGGDATLPTEPRVEPLSGHAVTDTVQAMLPQPLVVQVHGENGKPRAGAVVRFEPAPREEGGYVQVGPAAGQYAPVVNATTDGQGRAWAHVRLGRAAGAARVTVSVPELGLQTVVSYTVVPGAAVRIVAAPADTTVYVGASYALQAGLADRFGNLHPDPLTFEAPSPRVSASPSGTVTGVAVGRARVVVRVLNLRDSAFVSVVPSGTLSVRDLGRFVGDTMGIATVGLDGSGYRRLVALGITPSSYSPTNANRPEWIPGTDRLVHAQPTGGTMRLFLSDSSGSTRRLITAAGGPLSESDATVAPDGRWIYFAGHADAHTVALWRVAADGSGPERIPSSGAEPREAGAPSVSPDGGRLAYTARETGYANSRLFVRDLATGGVTSLPAAEAAMPRWSPRGDLIAYSSSAPYAGYSGALRVVRPDGTGDRPVIAGNYYPGVDWSPDGRYLLANRADPGAYGLELIDVQTGERIPLRYRRAWFSATWRR